MCEQNIAKSAPEAVLHYYISKYVDSNATLNCIHITDGGVTYTADIVCESNGYLYDIEFDSLTMHASPENRQKDIDRDIVFVKHGYTVVRMRNYTKTKSMAPLPAVVNIGMPLNFITSTGTFPKWQITESEQAIVKMLRLLGATCVDVSIEKDYKHIIDTYFPQNRLKHITRFEIADTKKPVK